MAQMHENLLTQRAVAALLGERRRESNKGSHGHGLLLAGSAELPGAALMAATAALRGGIGTLRVLCPPSVAATLASLPEAMRTPLPAEAWGNATPNVLAPLIEGATCLAIGPGMGRAADTDAVLEAALKARKPIIIDADALFALARTPQLRSLLHGDAVLTPHFGEMARLTGLAIPEIKARQGELARECAQKWGAVVLLKGAESVIAAPDGRYAWNVSGNAGLAKGGSGDVLAGLALAMLGQRLAPFDAACAAAYLLGASADAAVSLLRERMLMARDVTEMVAQTIENSVYSAEK